MRIGIGSKKRGAVPRGIGKSKTGIGSMKIDVGSRKVAVGKKPEERKYK